LAPFESQHFSVAKSIHSFKFYIQFISFAFWLPVSKLATLDSTFVVFGILPSCQSF